MSALLCACGQPARYYVFRANAPATAACVSCVDNAPFFVVVRRIEERPAGSRRVFGSSR